MTISAKIVADSVSPFGIRLTTLQLRYPKFIHGEFMTHRVFSRNASSSRAIPIERLIQDTIDDPALPVSWGKNQKGMQASEELNKEDAKQATAIWLQARDNAVIQARILATMNIHKQLVNRIIEPFCHINVVVTATEWNNFFSLRRHKDAQPEIRLLADTIWEEMQLSTPKHVPYGKWHLPYISEEDKLLIREKATAIKCSVARCARVSYVTHTFKKPTIEEDLALYERLVGAQPIHASPAEHQATPDTTVASRWANPGLHGNFTGWKQYRKTIPGENGDATYTESRESAPNANK